MIRLTAQQREILAAAHQRADFSVSKLSKLLGCSQAAVRHTLDFLKTEGYIRRSIIVDVCGLGYTLHHLFFSLESRTAKKRDVVLRAIAGHPRVAWLGAVSGRYDYEVTFLSRSAYELDDFLSGLGDLGVPLFEKKVLGIQPTHYYFGLKFLSAKVPPVPPVVVQDRGMRHEVDTLDLKILRLCCGAGDRNETELSRVLGIPPSTFAYRKKKLTEQGVIVSEFFELNYPKLGIAGLYAVLTVRKPTKEFRKAFYLYCERHPNIKFLLRVLGEWDYKIGIYAETSGRAARVLDELREAFENELGEVEAFTYLRDIKNDFYPDDEPLAGKRLKGNWPKEDRVD